MTEPRHRRYYAQELVLDPNANVREQIQEALDANEGQDWHTSSGCRACQGRAA